jgi:predicted alpha/beta superfamily hydrolase
MVKRGLAVLLTLLAFSPAIIFPLKAQQDGEPVSIGTYRTIHSKILGEDRTLLVHLPRAYEQASLSYPVIYMLYGDHVTTYFAEAVSVADRLGPTARTPEFILVGLMNTNRYRDLLPEADGRPTGIGDFIRFLNDELFPYVEKHYRTKTCRILVGPQAGANFALYAMMTNPDMFDAFIIETPFRWRGGRDLMMDMASSFFEKRKTFNRFMHITYREKDDLEKEALPYLEKFVAIVDKAECQGFRLKLNHVVDTDEFLPPSGVRDGLKQLFIDYPLPQDLKVESLDDVLAYYRRLSAEYGFEVDVPQHVLSQQSNSLMQRGRTEEMLRVLGYVLEKDPNSGDALWQLGNYYERTGELEKAVEYYQRMIKFMGSDAGMIKGRVEELRRKIAERRKDPRSF